MIARKSSTTIRPASWYGWIPDLPDQRDHAYAKVHAVPRKLPAKVDLRAKCPPVENQGQLGSCTANALAGALEFLELKAETSTRRPVAAVHLLQRARDRAFGETGCGRDAARRHQDPGQAGRVSGKTLALRHQEVRDQAHGGVLRAGENAHHFQLSAPFHHAGNARLPGGRLSVRVRLHRVRKFRVGCGGE